MLYSYNTVAEMAMRRRDESGMNYETQLVGDSMVVIDEDEARRRRKRLLLIGGGVAVLLVAAAAWISMRGDTAAAPAAPAAQAPVVTVIRPGQSVVRDLPT